MDDPKAGMVMDDEPFDYNSIYSFLNTKGKKKWRRKQVRQRKPLSTENSL